MPSLQMAFEFTTWSGLAGQGHTIFFRIVISPDPTREDRGRDLHLPDITAQTLLRLEARLQKPVQFIAAEHNDHTPHRHVHALVLVPGRLTREDLLVLRQAATELARFQRQERDLARESLQRGSVALHGTGTREPKAKPLSTTQTCYSCGTEQPRGNA